MGFKDYFSAQAAGYVSHRPHYPASLFQWLATQCQQHHLACDCATGSGQAAVALAPYFTDVIATDASHAQLLQAIAEKHVNYICAEAEQLPLGESSVDIITVAQAIHWFDRPRFYRQVDRLLVNKGILAIWCYGLFQISTEIDALINDFYNNTVGPYWPAERRHIEEGYQAIDFPYPEIPTPAFSMQLEWNFPQVMGYLATWSATQLYIKEHGEDPLTQLAQPLTDAWGDPQQVRSIHWPLTLKAGHKP